MLPICANACLQALLAAFLLVPVGASAAGKLAFAPASLDFGANALGEVKTKVATLKNTTAADIALGVAILVDNPGGYVIASTTCGATLGAGQSCKYTLRYTAKTLQLAEARLELTTQNPAFPLLKLPLQANLYPALNDTGITRCSNEDTNGLSCPVPKFPEQDAQFGRDKTAPAASNGNAGFNFTKLDSLGQSLPRQSDTWDCVRDNVTGLVWDHKDFREGLHNRDDRYSWYSTVSSNNGGTSGEPDPNGKTCFCYVTGNPSTYCNTEAYVKRVNAAGWCGFGDWRLPDRFELLSLKGADDYPYFSDAPYPGRSYWSSTPHAYLMDKAWSVDPYYGTIGSSYNKRNSSMSVRLVRGGR